MNNESMANFIIVAKFTNKPIIDVWDILSCGILGVVSTMLFFIGRNGKDK